jgi:hypothetical protein
MTLIEVLVSLLILAIIMAGIIVILQVQQSRAISVRSQAILHTEAQVALSIIKWDFYMAGYAIEQGQWMIQDGDGAGPLFGRDQVTLRGGVLGIESRKGRWNQILEGVSGQSQVKVRRWDETDLDFIIGDSVILADLNSKKPFEINLCINDTARSTTARGEPAWLLTLNRPVSAAMGSFLFMIDPNTYYAPAVRYSVDSFSRAGRSVPCLVRNYAGRQEILLENVEEFQVQYGIDANRDGIINDPGEWEDELADWGIDLTNQDDLREQRFMIRFGIVSTTDRPIPNYTYPQAAIALFNNNYPITPPMDMYRRVIMFEEIVPRNIRGR